MKSLSLRVLVCLILGVATSGCQSFRDVYERHPMATRFMVGSLVLCTAGALRFHNSGHGPIGERVPDVESPSVPPNCGEVCR